MNRWKPRRTMWLGQVDSDYNMFGISATLLLTRRVVDVMKEDALAHLNRGEAISAEIPPTHSDNRAFVAILPAKRTDAPHEEYRYLNSRYSMFQLYVFHIIRVELRRGFEHCEDDWDYFMVTKDQMVARSQEELEMQLRQWLPDGFELTYNGHTDCPL